jgi:predicted dehydrogenase
MRSGWTRRQFVGTAAAAAAGLAAAGPTRDAEPLRIGLIGCGGRGAGAVENCIGSSSNVKLVALGDLFADRLDGCRKALAAQGHRVEDQHCFVGFDAYKRVLEAPIDLVLLASPPGFRPLHIEAAVEAGKHVFMEKPIAVDPVGVRRVLAAGQKGAQKKLAMVAGTQYRHQEGFIETIRRIHEGAIGPIVAGRCFYNAGELWFKNRKPDWSEMEYQTRNWIYFTYLSGDQMAEQHIHTIDVVCWTMKGPPVAAVASGGRQVRTHKKYGDVYDHFGVDYEFPGGVHVMSLCRQMNNTANIVNAYFVGTRGEASPYDGTISGEIRWKYEGGKTIADAYVQEHADLIASIRAEAPLNETRQVAESTLTAIMGREAAYTGRRVTWEEMIKSDLDLSPPRWEFGPAPERKPVFPGMPRVG